MRLSDFKDEKAIEVVAALMEPIGNIAANPENQKARETGGTRAHLIGVILRNNAKDVMQMLAILDDKDPAEYHCTAVSVFSDTLKLFSDPEIMELFGLQSKTPASSGSASENTEAPGS